MADRIFVPHGECTAAGGDCFTQGRCTRKCKGRADALAGDAKQLRAEVARLEAEQKRLRGSLDFYRVRCEAIQHIQSGMRDPERKAVCDILANGSTSAITPVQEAS